MLGTLDGPIINAANVSPSDSTVITMTRGLWIGGAGNVQVQFGTGGNANTIVKFVNVPAGSLLPVRVNKVFSGNTSATDILALY